MQASWRQAAGHSGEEPHAPLQTWSWLPDLCPLSYGAPQAPTGYYQGVPGWPHTDGPLCKLTFLVLCAEMRMQTWLSSEGPRRSPCLPGGRPVPVLTRVLCPPSDRSFRFSLAEPALPPEPF